MELYAYIEGIKIATHRGRAAGGGVLLEGYRITHIPALTGYQVLSIS